MENEIERTQRIAAELRRLRLAWARREQLPAAQSGPKSPQPPPAPGAVRA
jgi:hypothetical protein